MDEPKFKPGMMAWSPKSGFAICQGGYENMIYPIIHGYYSYTHDGRNHPEEKHPTLLTVEQARKLGYEPPKRKVMKTLEAWCISTEEGTLIALFYSEESARRAYKARAMTTERVVRLTSDIEVDE